MQMAAAKTSQRELETRLANMEVAHKREVDQLSNRVALEQHRLKQETKRAQDLEAALCKEVAAIKDDSARRMAELENRCRTSTETLSAGESGRYKKEGA